MHTETIYETQKNASSPRYFSYKFNIFILKYKWGSNPAFDILFIDNFRHQFYLTEQSGFHYFPNTNNLFWKLRHFCARSIRKGMSGMKIYRLWRHQLQSACHPFNTNNFEAGCNFILEGWDKEWSIIDDTLDYISAFSHVNIYGMFTFISELTKFWATYCDRR